MNGQVPFTRNPFPKGLTFRWFGSPLRLSGARDALLLEGAQGEHELRLKVPSAVAKLRRARDEPAMPPAAPSEDGLDRLILARDGDRWQATVARAGGDLLLSFDGELPPPNRDLRIAQSPLVDDGTEDRQTICFTPGTRIGTPQGPRLVDDLLPGDLVTTRDDGAQPVLWTGTRHVSGARLFAMPHLRPIRLRAGALGDGRPQPDLVVSPDHQVLLSGRRAQALWDTDEVLVRARDLVDDCAVIRDHGAFEATYLHLLFARHQVVEANGVWVESFHPEEAELGHLTRGERRGLNAVAPEGLPYGPHARRCLSAADLALMRHEGAPRYLA